MEPITSVQVSELWNSLFHLEASHPPQLTTCPQTVFVRSFKSVFVLFKRQEKKIHRDSSAELSVLSSLDTLKTVSLCQMPPRPPELRPVSLMVSCFCKHVSFWELWHRYCYFACLSQECAHHFSTVACFLDFFALLMSIVYVHCLNRTNASWFSGKPKFIFILNLSRYFI